MGLGRIRLSDLGLETFWAESPKRSKTWSGICLDEPSPDISRAEPEIKSPCKTLARAFIGLQFHFFHAARKNAARRARKG